MFKFYKFWDQFRSARLFKVKDEHDLEEAENRDEKRWMKLENQKMQKGRLKKEALRIKKLVARSYKHDVRIIRHQ